MERTFDTPGRLEVVVRVPAGRVLVRASDRTATHVSIEGERSPEDIRIDVDPLPDGGHRVLVERRAKREGRGSVLGFLSGHDLLVVLEIPHDASLTCETGSADLHVDGPLGRLDFKTGSGDCRFADVSHDVAVKTASGDIQGSTIGGDLTAHTASGDVSAGAVGGRATVRTASGDIRLGPVNGSAQLTAVSGDVEVASLASGSATARSVSGDLILGVAEGIGVYLDVSSATGDVRSDLDPTPGSNPDGADLEITASSVSGDVRIRRAEARAANP
jgi:hypothetical protein